MKFLFLLLRFDAMILVDNLYEIFEALLGSDNKQILRILYSVLFFVEILLNKCR